MALALHHADPVHQDTNRIRTVINEVSKNVSDSNGNFKSWVVKTCWRELSLNGVVYRRFLGETHCLVQRGVLGQPQTASPTTFMSHGRPHLLTTCPRDITIHLSSPAVQLLSLKHATVEQRIERLVQLLIAAGLADAPDHPQSTDNEQLRHIAHNRPALSPRLLSLLASTVARLISDGALEDCRKAVPDPVRGEKVIPTPEKQGLLHKTELLQLINNISSQLVAETAAQPKLQTTVDRSVVVLPTELPPADKPSISTPGTRRMTGEHPISKHDNPDGQKVAHKPGLAPTSKPGTPPAPVTASLSAALPAASTPLSTILASAIPTAMQPPPAAESGQKQLPPIILPNVGQGSGNRSERKKSKKERDDEDEEEERERSRNPFLFDDEDPSEDEEC